MKRGDEEPILGESPGVKVSFQVTKISVFRDSADPDSHRYYSSLVLIPDYNPKAEFKK